MDNIFLNNKTATDYVVKILKDAHMKISSNDIHSVQVQKATNNEENCLIFVIFETFEIKQRFLALKSGLPRTLKAFDALSDEAFALFKCAKCLKRHGYKFIYHNGGRVFAKRSGDHPSIHIQSFQQVRDLKVNAF